MVPSFWVYSPKPATSLTLYFLPTNNLLDLRSNYTINLTASDHRYLVVQATITILWSASTAKMKSGSAIVKLLRRFQCAIGLALLSSQETDDLWVGFIVFGESETGVLEGLYDLSKATELRRPQSQISLQALWEPWVPYFLFCQVNYLQSSTLRYLGKWDSTKWVSLQFCLHHTTDALYSLSGYYVK